MNSLDNCKRCPRCNHIPDVTVETDFSVTLSCPQHGHMAIGNTLEKAVSNWNHYWELREALGLVA